MRRREREEEGERGGGRERRREREEEGERGVRESTDCKTCVKRKSNVCFKNFL